MIIRQAALADVAALSALACETYADAFGASITPEDLATQLRKTRTPAAFRAAMVENTILIALIADNAVGYVHICDLTLPVASAVAGDQQIDALYVKPGHQGQGIGGKLLGAALALPRLRRSAHVYLDVWKENSRAVALYRRFGFKAVGTHVITVGGCAIGADLIMVRPADQNTEI